MEWTLSAERVLKRLLQQAEGLLGEEGADPEEVAEDIRHHIETEMQAADATVITADDVRRLLQAMGVPVLAAPEGEVDAKAPAQPRQLRVPAREPGPPVGGLVLFGILLPLTAIVVELSTRVCATSFFDPLPTIGHVILFGSIVVAAFVLCFEKLRRPRLVGWLSGFAIGAAIIYSLRFLPLLPISLFAMLIGFGFLSLSPFPALWALGTARARHEKRLQRGGRSLGSVWWGIGAAVVFALVIEISPAVTRLGLDWAIDPDAETRARGVSLLRAVGNEDQILRACYQREGETTGLLGWAFAFTDAPGTEQARQVYYRVTGRPFNSVPPPKISTRSSWSFLDSDTEWSEQGGDVVGARVRGLRLANSRLDGSIDGVAALAYTEWTLEFENLSGWAQEARAQIQLPPGGIVSRLTLWVNGVEREAVFGDRGQVTEAYREIAVRRRRDPVLVRTSGPDRILVQCFPVPAGGRMKVRLGLTAPLELEEPERGFLASPYFVERNFDVPERVVHSVWWESHAPIRTTSEGLQTEKPEDDVFTVRGSLTDADLVAARCWVEVDRPGASRRAWTPDPEAPQERVIVQRIVETDPPRRRVPEALAIVVDGSRLMEGELGAVADAIQRLPEGIELHVIVTREEEPEVLVTDRETNAALLREAAGLLSEVEVRGGTDAVPALEQACDAVSGKPGGVVVWVVGPQPIELRGAGSLTQRFDRRPDGVAITAIQAVPGANRVLEALDGYANATMFSRRGDLAGDLTRLFRSWGDARPGLAFERSRLPQATALREPGKRTSLHLAKLWARDEVDALLRRRPRADVEAAQLLGASYRIVTPVTGAVVLETDEQYLEAGLAPPSEDDGEVPTIPEPETWALMIAVALLLLYAWFGRRRRPGEVAA